LFLKADAFKTNNEEVSRNICAEIYEKNENLTGKGFLGTQRYQKGTQSWYIESIACSTKQLAHCHWAHRHPRAPRVWGKRSGAIDYPSPVGGYLLKPVDVVKHSKDHEIFKTYKWQVTASELINVPTKSIQKSNAMCQK